MHTCVSISSHYYPFCKQSCVAVAELGCGLNAWLQSEGLLNLFIRHFSGHWYSTAAKALHKLGIRGCLCRNMLSILYLKVSPCRLASGDGQPSRLAQSVAEVPQTIGFQVAGQDAPSSSPAQQVGRSPLEQYSFDCISIF